jgi:hypothetical protein
MRRCRYAIGFDWSGRGGRANVSLATARRCKTRRTYLLLLDGDDDVLLGEDVDEGVDEDWEEVEVGVDEMVSEGWEEEDDCTEDEEESVDEGVDEEVGVEDVVGETEDGVGVFELVSTEGDCEEVGEGVGVGVTDGLTEALR